MQSDTQVTTIVQQIDSQGPAVVDRISTQFAELACTQENAKQLVEALHSGASVTLNANGKTATFTPTTKLGYGEAFIAMSLAAEALRNAGVSGCATPDQWQAVLLGGPLSAAGTSSTSTSRSASATSSSSFPGILALHSQGQGWGQIAQTTNVKLGQVMSSARSSLNLSTSADTSLAPTGRSPTSSSTLDTSSSSTSPSSTSSGKDKDKDKDADKDAEKSHAKPDDLSSGASSATSTSSSTATPSSSSSSSTTPRSSR